MVAKGTRRECKQFGVPGVGVAFSHPGQKNGYKYLSFLNGIFSESRGRAAWHVAVQHMLLTPHILTQKGYFGGDLLENGILEDK